MTKFQRYVRAGLAQVGLYDKHAAKVGLKHVFDSDVFIVSFPKSGNTWVRFLLANMLEEEKQITFKNVNDYVPGIYAFRTQIDEMKGVRFIKSHNSFYEAYPRMVYIYRDYRDVLISYYNYQIGRGEYEGSLAEFIKSEAISKIFGTWQNHVSKALAFAKENKERVLLISYEELQQNPEEIVGQLAQFCEIKPKRPIAEVVANCQFDNLQKIEKEHGKVGESSKLEFFRKGTAKQWQSVFSEDELNCIYENEEVRGLLNELGYETA